MMKKLPILTTIFVAALATTIVSCGTTPGAQTGNQGQKSYHLQVQGANGRQVQQGSRTIHVSSPTGGLYIPTNNGGGGGVASNGGTTPSNGGNAPVNGGGTTTTTTTTTTGYQSLPTRGNNSNGGSSGVGVKQANTNKGKGSKK